MVQRDTEPSILIEEGTPTPIVARIENIANRIDREPEDFRFTLEFLGGLVTEKTLDLGDEARFVPTTSQEPADLLRELFSHRYDKAILFDDATETALENDQEYQDLKDAHLNEDRSDRKREASNALRRYRIGFYIGRRQDWQNRLLTEGLANKQSRPYPTAG